MSHHSEVSVEHPQQCVPGASGSSSRHGAAPPSLIEALLRVFVAAANHNSLTNPTAQQESEIISAPNIDPASISPFWSSEVPAVALLDFANRIITYSGYGEMGMMLGLVLTARHACTRGADVPWCNLTMHRLLLTAVVVAAKANEDFFYRNDYECRVMGVTLADLNELEAAFLRDIHFAAQVSASDLRALRARCMAVDLTGPTVDGAAALAAVLACSATVALLPSLRA